MKSQLEGFQQVYHALRNASPVEALRMFEQVRSAPNLTSVLSDASKTGTQSSLAESSRTSMDTDMSSNSGSMDATGSNETRVVKRTRENSITSCPIWGLQIADIPNAKDVREATDGFFSCSGRLFHVFSQEQVEEHYNITFQQDSGKNRELSICCLAAVAAVGTQYSPSLDDSPIEGTFYLIAKHHLDYVIENSPFDAVKVIALLAMYNIMTKKSVSLAYVGKVAQFTSKPRFSLE
jgi:hypothetical protein